VSSVLPALIALALVSQSPERRVLIRDLDFDRQSADVAENATHAILRQLDSRPDLVVIQQPHAAGEPSGAELELDGGVAAIGSGYVGVLIGKDAATGRPKSGESCRSSDENRLIACLMEAVDRAVRGSDPIPVGRAGGSIVVNTLDTYRLAENIARNVTGILRLELQKVGGLRVVAEKGDWEVGGTVGRLDDTWIVHLVLLDPEKKIAHQAAEVFSGPQVEMIQATRIAARRLVGVSGGGKGDVAVVANVEEAQISIDGAPPQPFSRKQKLSLDPGKHHVALSAEGHRPMDREFYVLPGQTTTLETALFELEEPWYLKWWVWTAIGGALVLSGTLAGIAAANQPEDALIEVRIR
jgi:hypothetical protein